MAIVAFFIFSIVTRIFTSSGNQKARTLLCCCQSALMAVKLQVSQSHANYDLGTAYVCI